MSEILLGIAIFTSVPVGIISLAKILVHIFNWTDSPRVGHRSDAVWCKRHQGWTHGDKCHVCDWKESTKSGL